MAAVDPRRHGTYLEAMTLRVLTLGVGDAFSARWYSSSLALEAEGAWLLVDCPHPIRKILRESGEAAGVSIDVGDFSGVALTHLHADHASGLEGFGYFSHFLLGKRQVLLTHPLVAADLWDGHLRSSMAHLMPSPGAPTVEMDLSDYFDLRPLAEREATALGPFSVECRRTIHHIPTTAFRIRAGGRCLGYSADTAFDPDLIGWLAEADLVIHETNHGVHTPYEKLAALPAALRAKMRLIHYPDDFDVAGSAIEPLSQGRLFAV
jgi:ribonuclease BN (tRNA processing enzyme)